MIRPSAPLSLLLLLLLPLLVSSPRGVDAGASEAEAPSYRLRFPDRARHYAEVEATIPTRGEDSIELWMPAWTPGSYKIRDYARFLEDIRALDAGGGALPIEKIGKDRWRVQCAGRERFTLSYRVYGREMSVRTNWIERDFAMLNGAATFLVATGTEGSPLDVLLEPPPEWPASETGLPPHPDGAPHAWRAPDHDTLVDCPIVVGDLEIREFEVEGVPHRLVCHGGGDLWDYDRAAEDCRRIVEAQIAMWRVVPYESYRFLNMITESGGGLEHSNSTLMMASRYSFRDPDRYRRWLGLVSHEFFHTWNVKRLRPIALGPFDYTREVHTDDLWVVEGITSYYDDLMLARAGITDAKQYLKALSEQISSVQKTPGRLVHALAETSHDAWTHYYQRHENSLNSSISYYTKGAVVAFLLDAEIARASGGEAGLDEAMRLAYSRHSGARGYTSREFRDCCSEVAGIDLTPFFTRAVDSREELEYVDALAWFGLRFAPVKEEEEEPETPPPHDPTPGWIGLRSADRGGRLVVTAVEHGTPAAAVGLNVDDEIIAVDRYRVTGGGWAARMKQYSPGDEVTLLVARRGELLRLSVTLAEEPALSWKLERDPEATPEQRERLIAWLGAAGEGLREEDSEEGASTEVPAEEDGEE
ncbi:MAG: M61 family metallopeptidase [Planctomycetota bacterium]|jgi:predicted metalloprotease with PDZ domain